MSRCICRDPSNCLICALSEPAQTSSILTRPCDSGCRRIAPRSVDVDRGGGERARLQALRDIQRRRP